MKVVFLLKWLNYWTWVISALHIENETVKLLEKNKHVCTWNWYWHKDTLFIFENLMNKIKIVNTLNKDTDELLIVPSLIFLHS